MPPLSETTVNRPEVAEEVRHCLLTSAPSRPGVLVASAIQGQGGLGKTVLAQLLAHDSEIRTRFFDGIYWLSFGQEPNVVSFLSDLILAFDPTFRISTAQAASAHLQGLLSNRTVLLILDDVWEKEHIQPFLVGGDACRFLITTRRQYVAEDVSASLFRLDVMTPEQSLELLERYLGRSLATAERAQAMTVASAVGFLPLALNLTVARIRGGTTTWTELTTALRQEVGRLEALQGGRLLLSNQISLEAVLLLSMRYLQSKYPKAQELFSWFGVLPEDVIITPPMMATFWQMEEIDASDHLDLFWNEALLLPAPPMVIGDRDYPCFRLHDLIHHVARRMLEAPVPHGLGLSLMQAHQQVLGRYQEQPVKLPQREQGWAGLKEDGYIHEHLFWHLEKVGLLEQMVSVLQEETPNGMNAWFEVRESLGQTAGYVQDVLRAWERVRERSRMYHEHGELISTLGLELRFVLILTSLNSLATNIPVTLIASLVRYGIWKPIVGLAYIKRIPDAGQRTQALIAIAPSLPSTVLTDQALCVAQEITDDYSRAQALTGIASSVATAEKRTQVLSEALSVTRQIEVSVFYAQAMAGIAHCLAATSQTDQALLLAREIVDVSARANALVDIAAYLTEVDVRIEVLFEALSDARAIEDDYSRAKALNGIASQLAVAEERTQVLSEALAAARQVMIPPFRVKAITGVASSLTVPEGHTHVLSEALSAARGMEDDYMRTQALTDIASSLTADDERNEVLFEALTAAREVRLAGFRAKAIAGVVPHMAAMGQSTQALSYARVIEIAATRADALTGIAPYLIATQERDQVLSEALSAAREVNDNYSRVNVLTAIASCMTADVERTQVMSEALVAAHNITIPQLRAESLIIIAPNLTEAQLQDALSTAREIDGDPLYIQVLTGIAPYLAQHQLNEVLSVASNFGNPHLRAQALTGIVSSMKKAEERTQVLSKALSAARAIDDYFSCAQALIDVASFLTADEEEHARVLSEALAFAKEIEAQYPRTHAIIRIAHNLAETGQTAQALSLARELGEPAYRTQALIGIASGLPASQERTQVMSEALSTARDIVYYQSRAHSMAGIARDLASNGHTDQALSVVREIGYSSGRAQALIDITPHLTEGQLQEALVMARAIDDDYESAQVLPVIASFLAKPKERTEVLCEALSSTRTIEHASFRTKPLTCIGASLPNVASTDFYPLWSTLMRGAVMQTRENMQEILSSSARVLTERGGKQALDDVVLALRDVSQWWP